MGNPIIKAGQRPKQAGTKQRKLSDLAARINAAHKAVARTMRKGLQHAMEAGELLQAAKKLIPHGRWKAWVEEHTAVSVRTARAYMSIWRGRGALGKTAGTAVLDMTIEAALRAVSEAVEGPRVLHVAVTETTMPLEVPASYYSQSKQRTAPPALTYRPPPAAAAPAPRSSTVAESPRTSRLREDARCIVAELERLQARVRDFAVAADVAHIVDYLECGTLIGLLDDVENFTALLRAAAERPRPPELPDAAISDPTYDDGGNDGGGTRH